MGSNSAAAPANHKTQLPTIVSFKFFTEMGVLLLQIQLAHPKQVINFHQKQYTKIVEYLIPQRNTQPNFVLYHQVQRVFRKKHHMLHEHSLHLFLLYIYILTLVY